jgi:hypothetical protein
VPSNEYASVYSIDNGRCYTAHIGVGLGLGRPCLLGTFYQQEEAVQARQRVLDRLAQVGEREFFTYIMFEYIHIYTYIYIYIPKTSKLQN